MVGRKISEYKMLDDIGKLGKSECLPYAVVTVLMRHLSNKHAFSLQGMMSDLVLRRNELRQHLSDAIELFCKEVCSLPLQERKHSLEVSGNHACMH